LFMDTNLSLSCNSIEKLLEMLSSPTWTVPYAKV